MIDGWNPDKVITDRGDSNWLLEYDNTEGEYYHCGATSEAQWVDRGERLTLCGKKIQGLSWDFAIHFIENSHSVFSKKPQCPVCLEHPDMPLLLLGDMP